MWKITDLKGRAWEILRKNYWSALLAVFIFSVIGSAASSMISVVTSTVSSTLTTAVTTTLSIVPLEDNVSLMLGQASVIFVFLAFIYLFIIAASLSVLVFVTYPLQYGLTSWFVEQRSHETFTNYMPLFSAFQQGRYKKVASGMGWSLLWQILWSLCASTVFIIPSVTLIFGTGATAFFSRESEISSLAVIVTMMLVVGLYFVAMALYIAIILNRYYAYLFIPFILVDQPQLNFRETMDLSKRMTDGQKGRMWLLDLSFIGWFALTLLSCGFLSIALVPYIQTTRTELYFARKAEIAS